MEMYAIRYKECAIAEFEIEAESEQDAVQRFETWLENGEQVQRTMQSTEWYETSKEVIPLECSTASENDVLTDDEWRRLYGDPSWLTLMGFVIEGDVQSVIERDCTYEGFREMLALGEAFWCANIMSKYAIVATDQRGSVRAHWRPDQWNFGPSPFDNEQQWLLSLRRQLLSPENKCDKDLRACYETLLRQATEQQPSAQTIQEGER